MVKRKPASPASLLAKLLKAEEKGSRGDVKKLRGDFEKASRNYLERLAGPHARIRFAIIDFTKPPL